MSLIFLNFRQRWCPAPSGPGGTKITLATSWCFHVVWVSSCFLTYSRCCCCLRAPDYAMLYLLGVWKHWLCYHCEQDKGRIWKTGLHQCFGRERIQLGWLPEKMQGSERKWQERFHLKREVKIAKSWRVEVHSNRKMHTPFGPSHKLRSTSGCSADYQNVLSPFCWSMSIQQLL